MPWRWRARCPSTRPTAVRALSKVRSCVVRWLCRTWRSIRYAAASLLLSTSRILLSLRACGGGRLPGGTFRLSQGCGSIVRALLCSNPDVTVLYVTGVIYEKGAHCSPGLWLFYPAFKATFAGCQREICCKTIGQCRGRKMHLFLSRLTNC